MVSAGVLLLSRMNYLPLTELTFLRRLKLSLMYEMYVCAWGTFLSRLFHQGSYLFYGPMVRLKVFTTLRTDVTSA